MATDRQEDEAESVEPTTPYQRGFVPPAPEKLAKFFPQLEILELLGRGGMGAVYKARQPALDRLVAVKILPPEVGAEPAFAERFTREARALARLSHQNIVAVYDFGQVDGQFYFVMEYVDGANLRQLISSGRMQAEEALAIVPQICEALQFAHSEGVVHRDIKPENILVDRQGRVKIADFGLAKLLGALPTKHSLTGTHQVMGTPHYMAPEQMQSTRTVDHRADIYSLGVVFYEMLTGELPLGRFEPPSKKAIVDVRLDEVVLRALENMPERRYQRASEVKTDVETISHSPSAKPAKVEGVADTRPYYEPLKPESQLSNREPEDPVEIQSELDAPSIVLMVLGLLTFAGSLVTVVLCMSDPGDVDTAWFGVPGMISGGFMFLGGLSLRTLWSSGWAYLGAIAAVVPAGPYWLITVIIGIWVFNVLSRPHVRAAFTNRARRVAKSAAPRFSRKAIVGACWAPFFFVALLCFLVTTSPTRVMSNQSSMVTEVRVMTEDGEMGPPMPASDFSRVEPPKFITSMPWWSLALIVTVLPLGLTAPVGTTVLGLMSISDIRHGQGRIVGMPLALADALGFPLLALDGLIVAMILWLAWIVIALFDNFGFPRLNVTIFLPALLITVPICAAVDFLLARMAWRAAAHGPK